MQSQARFRPFPPVGAGRGAPMGRVSAQIDPDISPNDLAVAGPAGEYDAGGAYWGLPSSVDGPVWAVWVKGKGHEGVCYVRARSRLYAKLEALGTGWRIEYHRFGGWRGVRNAAETDADVTVYCETKEDALEEIARITKSEL